MIRQFLFLIFGVLIPIILVCFMLRQKGLNQRYAPLEHPMRTGEVYKIAYQAGSAEHAPNSWAGIEAIPDNWIVWIDVYQTLDEVIFLDRHQLVANRVEELAMMKWPDIKDKGFKTLEETLDQFPNKRFVLNITANARNIDLKIIKMLKEKKLSDQVIINSPFDVVISSTRKESPLWAYAMSLAEITRLMMFEGIYMEPAIPLDGEFMLISESKFLRRLTPGAIKEVKRRGKKVILGPMKEPADWEKWKALGADGFITDAPSKF